MNELRFQESFVSSILNRNHNISDDLKSIIEPIGNLDPLMAIEIYRQDYAFRLVDTLKSNFEALWMFLGDEKFSSLAQAYVDKYHSTEFDLNLYGGNMPQFVFDWFNRIENKFDYILLASELAEFEIDFNKLFHANDSQSPIDLGKASQERIFCSKLMRSDALMLKSFNYDVFELFTHRENAIDDFLKNKKIGDLDVKTHYLIFKKNQVVYCKKLNLFQFNFFQQLSKGEKSLLEIISGYSVQSQTELEEIFQFIGESLTDHLC